MLPGFNCFSCPDYSINARIFVLYFTVIADKHGLTIYRGMFFTAFFIMPNEMTNHDIKTVRIAKNDLQVGHVFLGLLDLVFVCTGFCLQAIILVTGDRKSVV